MEKHYLVNWPIDIWAETPEDAATQAMKIQRDPKSIAKVFDVKDDDGKITTIDLQDDPEKELRILWDLLGVPKKRQDAIIREIKEKAKPGATVGPFKIPE